uniref:APG6_N domain-containing protein n=1 Tax=Gongylonema pulchrum TaxID=637853 RepID=A0A183EC53_9BILA
LPGTQPGTSGNLFDMISNSDSALKGPMCEVCTERLLSGMDQHLQELDEECAQYNSLMRSLKERPDTSFLDKTALRAKLSSMKNEEASLLVESKKLEAEEAKLDRELNKRKRELCAVEKQCTSILWKTFRDNHRFHCNS